MGLARPGNMVVIKSFEVAAARVVWFAELATEAPGSANVTGRAETGAALVNHPEVRRVSFAGSTEIGKRLGAAASVRLAHVTLELGGKSPNNAFPGSDLKGANAGVLSSIFSAGGQSCIAGSRAFIDESINDAFVAGLVEGTHRVVIGNPTDPTVEIGPVASLKQFKRIHEPVRLTKASGGRVSGGGPAQVPGCNGYFYRPTILEATNDAALSQTEVLGPANINRAHRMVSRVNAETVCAIMCRASAFSAPFGGFKQSGLGVSNGVEAINSPKDSPIRFVLRN